MDWWVNNRFRDIVGTFYVLNPATGKQEPFPIVLRKGERLRVREGLAIALKRAYPYTRNLEFTPVEEKEGRKRVGFLVPDLKRRNHDSSKGVQAH